MLAPIYLQIYAYAILKSGYMICLNTTFDFLWTRLSVALIGMASLTHLFSKLDSHIQQYPKS